MVIVNKVKLRFLGVLALICFYIQRPSLDIGFSLKLFFFISIFFFFFMMFKKEFKIRLDGYDFIFLTFVFFGGATLFWAKNLESTARLFLGAILVFGCYQVLKSYIFRLYSDSRDLESDFYVASIAFVCLSIFLYLLGVFKINGDYGSFEHVRVYGVLVERGMPRLIGPLLDPNIFSFYTSIVFFYILCKENKNPKDYLAFSLVCFSLLLSMSRGGIIAISFSAFLFSMISFLDIMRRLRLRKITLIFIFVFILASFLSTYLLIEYTEFSTILERRFADISSGSGRFEIWENAFSIWMTSPIVGVGWFNFLDYNISFFGRGNYAHNTFIEVIVETGLIGFVIYLVFHFSIFWCALKLASKNRRYRFLLYGYLSMVFMMNSLSLVINEFFFMFLILLSVFRANENITSRRYGIDGTRFFK